LDQNDGTNALGICLDDGTGIHVFNDTIRNVAVKKGDYIKIFGALKPNKEGNKKKQQLTNSHLIQTTPRQV
jgi:hypothetical protein